MSRTVGDVTQAAAEAQHVSPYLLVDLDYQSGPVRMASTPFNIEYAGQTYIGIGHLGSISSIQEGPEQKSYGIAMRLSGIPLDNFRDLVAERFQDRSCRVWLGFLNPEHKPIGAPTQLFGGRMDVVSLELGETITVNLTAESRLVDWERARIRRYTDQDQKRAFPGDKGLEFVQATSEMELVWGRG